MTRSFGRYQPEVLIGRGSMGEVFRALDPELDRVVAIKVLTPTQSLPPAIVSDVRERFLREARTAAKLSHPNIVSIYDVGVTEHGTPFLVLELVDGPSFDTILQSEGPLSPKAAAQVGVALARALACAHQAGVIHRDVKPGNALRARDGTVKLMDFGIARLDESTLTAEGSFLGSPQFSSPEQIRGLPVTAASDLFSLGVTVYMLLAGTGPFARAKLGDTVRAIVLEKVPPITSIRSDLDAMWDAVLGRAIAKEPSARHPDAGSLASDFEALLVGSSAILAAVASVAERSDDELELVVVEGPDRGRRFALTAPVEIGRGSGDLALSDATVSSRHCRVEREGARVQLVDYKSRNGTWIRGERVERGILRAGEVFAVGSSTKIRIESRGPGATASLGTVVVDPSSSSPAPPRVASFVLRVLDGELAGRRFPVDRDLVIGRDEGDIRIDDERASRKHAVVETVGPGRIVLRDLASSNGTFLHGDRVRQIDLRVGDELTIGSTRIVVESP